VSRGVGCGGGLRGESWGEGGGVCFGGEGGGRVGLGWVGGLG